MIGKDLNGSYFVQIKVKDPMTGKWHTKKKRGFKLKRDAKAAEAEMISNGTTGIKAPFKAVAKSAFKANNQRASTYRSNMYRLSYFSKYSGMPIDSITKEMLVTWRSWLETVDLSVSTKNRVLKSVKQVFRYAERVYDLKNPSTILNPFKTPKSEKSEMSVWTPEEFQTFLSAIDGSDFVYSAFFTFLYWTGCRVSEARAVCWDDIDGNTVHIWRSVPADGNAFGGLKTDSSERSIRIDGKTLKAIKELPKTGCIVFGGDYPLPYTEIRNVFMKAVSVSGVKPIRIHDLRHSHATLLINSGVNIVAVSRRLGHSNINTTLSTYTHLLQKSDDVLIETIERQRGMEP